MNDVVRIRLVCLLLGLVAVGAFVAGHPVAGYAIDSCATCHAALPDRLSRPVEDLKDDVHAQHGVSCVDCHGGDSELMDLDAMDPKQGYRGAPARGEIPDLCAQCHSDPAYMRRFNPSLPTNQRERYWTSVHGKRLREGDERVATCVSCHGAHGIRPSNRADSPVYPINVPATCGHCHSDTDLMAPYDLPTNQEADYRTSVHGALLLNKRDLSAPTCATCHDKHGASPPEISSIEGVCGMCHVNNSQLFVQSPHKEAFDALGLPECAACHGKHDIKHTSDTMVGVGEGALCGTCHSPDSKGYVAAQRIRGDIDGLKEAMAKATTALAAAEKLGVEVSDTRYEFHAADDVLIKARTAVHRFSPEHVEEVIAPGMKLSAVTLEAAEKATAAGYLRRRQLIIPLVVIAVVMILLAAKLRQLERDSR